ncbi:MAG: YceD family protein [Chloroflexota bacterium]
MRLDVSEVRKRADVRIRRRFTIDPGELDSAEGVSSVSPLTVEAEASSTGEGVLVSIKAEGEITLQCSRCLEEFRAPLSLTAEQEFRDDANRAESSGDEQDDTLPLPADGLVDLTDIVRQAYLLALPMKPLCRPDCRGLCQVCGKNLNQGACDCVKQDIDPRFEKLRDLLVDKGVSRDGSAEEKEV